MHLLHCFEESASGHHHVLHTWNHPVQNVAMEFMSGFLIWIHANHLNVVVFDPTQNDYRTVKNWTTGACTTPAPSVTVYCQFGSGLSSTSPLPLQALPWQWLTICHLPICSDCIICQLWEWANYQGRRQDNTDLDSHFCAMHCKITMLYRSCASRRLTGIRPRLESDQTTCHAAIYIAVLFIDGVTVRR